MKQHRLLIEPIYIINKSYLQWQKKTLFGVFSPVSAEEWKAKITADLKGADFDKKLVWRTNEGFSVQPFYRKEDIEGLATIGSLPGEFPYVRGTRDNNDWLIRRGSSGFD